MNAIPLGDEQAIRDKRQAACHEAAHATVAAARCSYGNVWLIPSGICDIENRAWSGKFQARTPITASAAVAGMVGESLFHSPDVTPDELFDWWQCGATEPSDTDTRNIPDDWGERWNALVEAFDVLRLQRPLFERVVAELMEHEAVTDGEMKNLAEEFLVDEKPARKKTPKKGKK